MSAAKIEDQPIALSVRGLKLFFPGEPPYLKRWTSTLDQGEFVSVLAASGKGKTTLFRLLAGLLAPQSGTIAIGAAGDPAGVATKLRKIGYMPQRDCLMPWRTVLDNAALGLELGEQLSGKLAIRCWNCFRA